ncbi:MAG: hypothetical protein SFY81_02145 [Verrucomicrobiota bacterium]|nr:hypothetical protein [Verrucomicrobiota bacterium]
MKKQTNFGKLTLMAAGVAMLSVGCASSNMARNDDASGYQTTVTALSITPLTNPRQLGMFPMEWNIQSIETYTFLVPEPNVEVTGDLPLAYSDDLQPGDVFQEAAGADNDGEARAIRVIRHSPNPTGLGSTAD